jgi:MFS family permease
VVREDETNMSQLLWDIVLTIEQIVPVIPFVLEDRVGIPHDRGTLLPQQPRKRSAYVRIVQSWTSILLATFGGALVLVSGKILSMECTELELLTTITVITGWLCDRIHLRRCPFLGALVIQTGATVMLCLANSIEVLLTARILQGVSGGVVWTVSLIIMTDRVESAELGQALGYVALARTIGVVMGPLLGGVLYERTGYYSVFALSFAFLVIDGIFRLTFIEARTACKWIPSVYTAGRSSGEGAEDQICNTTEKGSEEPLRRKSSNFIASSFQRVLHMTHRRLPPTVTLLGDLRLDISLWGCFLQAVFLSGFDATIPIFVSRTFQWSSLAAGLIFLALVIPTSISPLIGWLSDKHGPRWYTAAGYILSTIPLILLRLVDHNAIGQKILLAALLAIFGATGTLFEIPVWAEVVKCTELRVVANPRQYSAGGAVGQAYGLLNLFYALGVTVGPLLTGFIYEDSGWSNMVLVLGVLSAASTVPTVLCTGGYIFKRQNPQTQNTTRGEAVLEKENINTDTL